MKVERERKVRSGFHEEDSYRYHRFSIEGEGLVGNLYFPKDSEIPETVEIKVKVNGIGGKESGK